MIDDNYFGKYTLSSILILCLVFVMVIDKISAIIFMPLIIGLLHKIINEPMDSGNLEDAETDDDDYECFDNTNDTKEQFQYELDETAEPVPKYNNSALIDAMFSDDITSTAEPVDGDFQLHRKMQDVQKNSERAAYIRTRFGAKNFEQNFIEEMDGNERARWWENDDLQALMVKDGVAW